MTVWHYCETLERVRGDKIRVLEHAPEKGMYREQVYNARDISNVVGEVYE